MRTSGEAVLSPCRPDEAESGPRGSDEAESLRSYSIGNVIGTYQLYLIRYPSIRSPTGPLQQKPAAVAVGQGPLVPVGATNRD